MKNKNAISTNDFLDGNAWARSPKIGVLTLKWLLNMINIVPETWHLESRFYHTKEINNLESVQKALRVEATIIQDALRQIDIVIEPEEFDFEVVRKIQGSDHSAAAASLARQQRLMLKIVSNALLVRTMKALGRLSEGEPTIDPDCVHSVLRFSEDGAITSLHQAVAQLQNEIAIQGSTHRTKVRACEAQFGISICEVDKSITRCLPFVGKKTCKLPNPDHWEMFLLAVDNDAMPTKSQVHSLQPDEGRRNNCVSRLRSKLAEIQLIFKAEEGCYRLKDLSK